MENVKVQKYLLQQRQTTGAFWVLTAYREFLIVERKWFTKYVRQEQGRIYDRYMANVSEEIEALRLLGSD